MELLLIMGAVFILIVFGLRFYAHKTMTKRVCSLNPDNDYCRKHYKKNMDKSDDPYTKCDVIYGETPNGGVKTVICYINDNNNMVKKEKASKVMVRELDKNNQPVYETWTSIESE